MKKLHGVVVCWSAILAGLLLAGGASSHSLCAPASAAEETPAEILTNGSVIELQKLNLGNGVIIDKIKASKCDFDVSVNGLKQLKEAQISDAIIQAMIATKSPAAGGGGARAAATGDPNDPKGVHDTGVWLCEESNGHKKMTKLEPESFRLWVGGGPFGGASRAVLTGLKASLQVSSPRPVFYMYFGEGGQGILGSTSPNQLPLAKFDLKTKTQERLLVVGSVAPFAGYNSGIKKESLRAVDADQVAAGIYRLAPKEALIEGEYGFCYMTAGGMGTVGRMFCFGLHAK